MGEVGAGEVFAGHGHCGRHGVRGEGDGTKGSVGWRNGYWNEGVFIVRAAWVAWVFRDGNDDWSVVVVVKNKQVMLSINGGEVGIQGYEARFPKPTAAWAGVPIDGSPARDKSGGRGIEIDLAGHGVAEFPVEKAEADEVSVMAGQGMLGRAPCDSAFVEFAGEPRGGWPIGSQGQG